MSREEIRRQLLVGSSTIAEKEKYYILKPGKMVSFEDTQINENDYVMLKDGGPKMFVFIVLAVCPGSNIGCEWKDDDGNEFHQFFSSDELRKIVN